jgi:cell division protein ZapA
MANINIKFNGKEFLLSCDDGQEEHLIELSEYLNLKFDKLKSELGSIGENKLLLITSIQVMDEYFETKKKIDEKKKELLELSSKFKELKSLVIDYRNKKDLEIKELNENQGNLRNAVEKNKETYEKIIEDATDQIESFIQKKSSENQIQ